MSHHHDQGCSAGHPPPDFGRAFAVGVALNAALVALQVLYGLTAHSLALLADAGHNLGDVFGLLLAWAAAHWARRAPTARHTYGWGRFSILAALGNSAFLFVSVGFIAWEAVRRLRAPASVTAGPMIWVSVIGIAVNALTAAMFLSGRKGDLNIRATFQHMAADAVLSAGVAIAGAAILVTGWLWLDPVMSLILAAVILVGTWKLLVESVDLAIDGVPTGIDATAVRQFLMARPGVADVHHLHIWGLSTTEVALTAHVIVGEGIAANNLLRDLNQSLWERFRIGHATFQLESGLIPECASRECGARQKGMASAK